MSAAISRACTVVRLGVPLGVPAIFPETPNAKEPEDGLREEG